MTQITTLRAFYDNFIYLWHDPSGRAVAVDPGQAGPVLQELTRGGLRLETVLLTHHHSDHTGGIRQLKQETGCRVLGPDAERIQGLDRQVVDGEHLELLGHDVRVLATPGHTRTSCCYVVEPAEGPGWVWTGDTLFLGGCGRLFECEASVMWQSLQRLAALPDDTVIYGGHDYTQENRAFALSVDPGHPVFQDAAARTELTSTVALERQTNIFLLAADAAAFAELRLRKDRF